MFIKKIVSKGLAHNSYITGDSGEALVIDPRRDIDPYINIADCTCHKIRFVFETHGNEDYLIGSLELQNQTGCRIIHSRNLDFGYGEPATGGDVFDIGGMKLRVLETPGHTPESLSFVLYSLQGDIPQAVFTGDALFYGNVGRTDLLGKDKRSEFSSLLYDSLHDKLLSLGDQVVVYPAHGKGSVCSGSGDISSLAISTIGYEKTTNPMLNLSKEEFIKRKMGESLPIPPYFKIMREHNTKGPELFESRRIRPMDTPEFADEMAQCTVIDARSPYSFASGHIMGSYNIWLNGMATFSGWILDYGKDLLLVTERQEDIEIIRRYLERIGFDRIRGYLCKGIEDWQNCGMALSQSGVDTASGLYEKLKENKNMFLLDVRSKEEYASGHIPGAVNIYVGELENRLQEVPSDRPVVSICSVGRRGGLGASILARHGYSEVYNLLGGMTAWKEKGYPIEIPKT